MFLFRLAAKLGIWDVDGLAEQMPADLATRWRAYYELEPWDQRVLAAMVARVVDLKLTELTCMLARKSDMKDRLIDPDVLIPGRKVNDA